MNSPRQTPNDAPRRAPRKAPRYGAFLVTGAVIGLVVGVLFGMRSPGGPSYIEDQMGGARYTDGTASMFLGLFGLVLGAAIGGLIAISLDRTKRD